MVIMVWLWKFVSKSKSSEWISISDGNSCFRFEFFDSEATSIDMTVPIESNSLVRPTVFTNKNFVLSGVTLYTDEFSVYKNYSSMTESLSNRLIGVRNSPSHPIR